MSWKLQLSSMKSWMRREEVRSQAGQPAAMQEEGCEALGPRRGSGRTGVEKTRVERATGPLPFSSERVRGESGVEKEDEEGENMPYIGPVTSQVMGLRVTNGS